tara:strand:+ start:78675 stop:80954 length:2280 start_codon:yes stop_codon:yes gene_type:complete
MNFRFWRRKKNKPVASVPVDSDYQYEIKSYSKDGGFIQSLDRAGRNQNGSIYGGMSEREIQLRLELVVEQVLTTARSVFAPAQQLTQFSLADQERFIQSANTVSAIDAELSYHFCHLAPAALMLLDEGDWLDWIEHITTQYQAQDVTAAITEMRAIEAYVASKSSAPSSVSYDEISRVIESIVLGLNGRSLSLESSESLFTDTETLHLPERLSEFKTRDENFALYKSIAVHQWAQTWFGTFRINIQQLVTTFKDSERALNLFHALETVRLDKQIERELPGIARAMRQFNSLLVATELPEAWQQAVKKLSMPEATVHDTAELLYALYDQAYLPEPTLYQGEIDPTLANAKIQERSDQEKTELQEKLTELREELMSSSDSMPGEGDGEDGTDEENFELREVEDDERPDGYRYDLELDGKTVDTPEEIQALLDSIQQDLGDIPENYLETNEDKAATDNSGLETDKESLEGAGEALALYDEWDHSRQKYRKDYCHLFEHTVPEVTSDFAAKTLKKHYGLMKSLNRTFEALRDDNRRLRKQPYGEDIDLDAVIESYADIINGHELSQNLFIKQRKVDRNIAVMFMVDMSGSTSGWINEMEREALILLCESLQLLGDQYAIYGFSGRTHQRCDLYRIKEFDEPYSKEVKGRIAGIKPQDYTRMGVAIRHLSKLLSKVEAKSKLLITLSDGRPDDQDGYRGVYGIEDTRRALVEAKFLGIHPFCITIDTESADYLKHMYGPVNFTIVDQVDKLPYKVSDIYRRITM